MAARLVLIEGLPGAGKSTLAQALLRACEARGLAARWWYEEVADHPVYLFRDLAGLRAVVDDLAAGEFAPVIAAALAQWRRFAASVAAGDGLVIADGALFGYLAWSLFPFGAPEATILDYLAAVADILRGAETRVIYLRQGDPAATWRWLGDRRGADWERRAIERACGSPYGQRHGLRGFAGLVAFWSAYGQIADTAFARLPPPKLRLGASADDWAGNLARAAAFLGLAPIAAPPTTVADLGRRAGRYLRRETEREQRATVFARDGALWLTGVPHLWPQNRLLPLPSGDFAVESFPFTARFAPGRLMLEGPELLGGSVVGVWEREAEDSSRRGQVRTPLLC